MGCENVKLFLCEPLGWKLAESSSYQNLYYLKVSYSCVDIFESIGNIFPWKRKDLKTLSEREHRDTP